jgi:WD40 repeat protein
LREEKQFFSITDTLGPGTLKIPIGQLPQYSRLFAVAPGRDKLLVGVFGEKNIYSLLNASTLKADRTFAPEGLGWQMGNVCFSRDGSRIALKAEHIDAQRQRRNNTVHVYNVATGERIGMLSPPGGTIYDFRFAPSGDTLFISEAEAVHWMDATTGAILKTFTAGSEKSSWSYSLTSTICVTRDAELLAVGDYNGTIYLWDVQSGKLIRTLPNQGHYVSSVLITSDKKRLWSVGRNDGTVRVADIATGNEIARFISFMDGQWVVITPEGFYNASPDGDKYLNVRLGMEIFGIENFRKTFFQPESVKQKLTGGLR